ncbi:MAG: hypothetical protein IKL49_10050 [Lachnospiraceae bacterium]|nr:hypothetical protein [Lachnospiraceae bacterium]
MDNFIDRLAQKFTAGEVIRANAAAEERELRRLREQVAEYERCLQEMRKVQMTNTQTARNLHDLMVESTESIRKLTQEGAAKIADIQLETEAQKAEAKKSVETAAYTMEKMEEKVVKMQETVAELTEALEKNQKEIAEWFKQADDFLHKENVKVYRNVQAVVVDEVAAKAENIMKSQEEAVKKSRKPVLVFAVLGFLAAAASLTIQILDIMGMLAF